MTEYRERSHLYDCFPRLRSHTVIPWRTVSAQLPDCGTVRPLSKLIQTMIKGACNPSANLVLSPRTHVWCHSVPSSLCCEQASCSDRSSRILRCTCGAPICSRMTDGWGPEQIDFHAPATLGKYFEILTSIVHT